MRAFQGTLACGAAVVFQQRQQRLRYRINNPASLRAIHCAHADPVRVASICNAARKDVPGKAKLFYFGHLFGRSEVYRMTLIFSGLDWEFVGFDDAEWAAAKPKLKQQGLLPLGSLPFVQLDGQCFAQTLAACRYIAQRTGTLYPDVTDVHAVHDVEYILECAQEFFAVLVKYHYRKYNTKGGARVESGDEDRAIFGEVLCNAAQQFFEMLSDRARRNPEGYMVGKTLTLADIFVCQYRWLLDTPEFHPLMARRLGSPELAAFEAYYARMLEKHFGEYFRTRHGTQHHSDAAETKRQCDLNRTAYDGKFPFEW